MNCKIKLNLLTKNYHYSDINNVYLHSNVYILLFYSRDAGKQSKAIMLENKTKIFKYYILSLLYFCRHGFVLTMCRLNIPDKKNLKSEMLQKSKFFFMMIQVKIPQLTSCDRSQSKHRHPKNTVINHLQ